jgi:hypothetical protein
VGCIFAETSQDVVLYVILRDNFRQCDDPAAVINDRLSYEAFIILFLLLQEKNQKKQA